MDNHVELPSLLRLAIKIVEHDRENNVLYIECDEEAERLSVRLDHSEPRAYRAGELYEFWVQLIGEEHYLQVAFQLNVYEYGILRDTLRLMRRASQV